MKARFNEITSVETLEELFNQSNERAVFLFKHSTTCPISADIYRQISGVTDEVNLIVVQKARDVSDAVTRKTGIRHESPQAIVLKKGKAVYHASHYDITAEDINTGMRDEI